MELLYRCGPNELDNFIFQNLQPNREFNQQVCIAIDIICGFLKHTCFMDAPPPRPKVLKMVKGGSYGKGTALKGGSDVDLVLFFDIFNGYEAQETNKRCQYIIQEIERRLKEKRLKEWLGIIWRDIEVRIEKPKWDNPRMLSFQLHSRSFIKEYRYIDFDVLLAFDALGHYRGGMPDPQVYTRLIHSSGGCGGQFSPCFTELQKDFIRKRPAKLKDLIRLVKYWHKQLPYWESKPPKYALELLAVYAWEQDGEKIDFNMAEGFRTVLWLIQQHRHLCIFWTKYYDFQNETLKQYLHTQLRKPRPVILDPADPTGIVGEGKRWDLLAQEAADFARQALCFRKLGGSMVQPWDVPAQNVQLSKDMTLASNRSLAEGSLLYQSKLDALNAALTQKYQELQVIFEAYQIKKTKLDRQSSNASLENLLALLQTEGAKIEEDTENMAEKFLDGEVPLDTFIDEYQSQRKLAHLQRVKIEKLQEMVQKGPRLPLVPPQPRATETPPAIQTSEANATPSVVPRRNPPPPPLAPGVPAGRFAIRLPPNPGCILQ